MIYFDKTKLEVGRIYVDEQQGAGRKVIIFKLISTNTGRLISDFLNTNSVFNKESIHSDCSVGDNYFRNPTPTESKWLEDCIYYNKTITLEESIALHKHEIYDIF